MKWMTLTSEFTEDFFSKSRPADYRSSQIWWSLLKYFIYVLFTSSVSKRQQKLTQMHCNSHFPYSWHPNSSQIWAAANRCIRVQCSKSIQTIGVCIHVRNSVALNLGLDMKWNSTMLEGEKYGLTDCNYLRELRTDILQFLWHLPSKFPCCWILEYWQSFSKSWCWRPNH